MKHNSHRLLIGFICLCVLLAVALFHPRASRGPALSRALKAAPTRNTVPKPESDSRFANTRSKPGGVSRDSAKTFERLPIYFELNQGQADPRVKFISRGVGGATTFLAATETVFALPVPDSRFPIEHLKEGQLRNEVNPELQSVDPSLLMRQ